MNKLLLKSALLLIVFLAEVSSFAKGPSLLQAQHLGMLMSSAEYQRYFKENPFLLSQADAEILKPILDFGKRNLDWLIYINEHRDPYHPLSFTSKETEPSHPIDQADEYNVEIALKRYQDLVNALPSSMLNVLKGGALTSSPPLSDEDYLSWGLKTDRVYQTAMRWLTMAPYLDSLADRQSQDIRGYYFLNLEHDLQDKLEHWDGQDAQTQGRLKGWLIGICGNQNDLSSCTSELDQLLAKHGAVQDYYDRYVEQSKKLFFSYFSIEPSWARSDVQWTAADSKNLHLPFADPNNPRILNYLKSNIEDEWKWNSWQLHLDFQSDSGSIPHLTFESGVTPHAIPDQGTIVMDENQPTTEYESQWTIRHEFGHILGFVDCYVEFYDPSRKLIVNYQIDTSNLMCSRRGTFKEIHFQELKRVYFKSSEGK